MKKYLVTLTTDEREQLNALISAGKAAAKKLAHARILLKADQAVGGSAWPDEAIAEKAAANRLHVTLGTLRKLGLDEVIEHVPGGWRVRADVPTLKLEPRDRIDDLG